ncbi:MAG: ATP-binding protein [Prevotellaceae bacterium]|nr:ATP-binding protein [Prevotellaceae bacterium]
MNINRLIETFFQNQKPSPTIEVFDKENIYSTYRDIVSILNYNPNIELTILQGLSYCFYEILDNVLTHSEKECGTVLMSYRQDEKKIQILVADDGIGIRKSLSANPKYSELTEEEALTMCIEDSVTDGKGMGFGLYSTLRLVENVGTTLTIVSGDNKLICDNNGINIEKTSFWQGTIVYFELHSNKEIIPEEILGSKTNCVSDFNEMFDIDDGLNDLW